MGDIELIRELIEAVRKDSERPVLNQRFNPVDPVAIEIVLHEADFAVESYMEKWKGYRGRLGDPSLYDDFVLDFQMKVRKDVKTLVATAQQFIADELEQERLDEENYGEEEET